MPLSPVAAKPLRNRLNPQVVEVTKIVTEEVEVPVEVTRVVSEEVTVTETITETVEVTKIVTEEVVVTEEVEVEVTKIVEVEAERDRPELVFAGLSWQSALVQNGVARYIVEHGYGYPTSEIEGDTVPLFQGSEKRRHRHHNGNLATEPD